MFPLAAQAMRVPIMDLAFDPRVPDPFMPPARLAPHSPAGALGVVLLLCAVALAAFGFALASGSIRVPARAVLDALWSASGDADIAIVRDLRLPRAMTAFAAGGLLAVAGALMQVLLRNPLADPYVLGLSGGAAAGALAALALGWAALAGPAAFAGALASSALVFGLARVHADRTAWTATRLLLTGVIVASGWSAIVLLLLALAPDGQIRGMMFWLIGDLSAARYPGFALAVLAAIVALALTIARDLNVLLRGHDIAASLGVPVTRMTLALYAMSALATAVAVMAAGTIGFVGLVVPHALRLLLGNDQRLLLPAAALAGGALLTIADTLARTIAAPLQLPAGVLTACLGVPLFLWLLLRR